MKNHNTKNKIINTIQQKVSSIYPRSVSFIWIPAHSNISGNALANMAAKKATTNNFTYKIHLSSFNDRFRIAIEQGIRTHENLRDEKINNKLHQIKPALSQNRISLTCQDENRQYSEG